MNNKILVGSIIAVIILVLVSFTGVVGYQTTKSSAIAKTSPLFSVRSNRAIDKDSKDITCDYVGKGEEINIQIPKRNTNGNLLIKALNRIKRMDRDTIKRVLDKFMNNRDFYDRGVLLSKLRTNPLIMNNINNSFFKADNLEIGLNTYFEDCGTFIYFRDVCLADWLFILLIVLAGAIALALEAVLLGAMAILLPFIIIIGIFVTIGWIIQTYRLGWKACLYTLDIDCYS